MFFSNGISMSGRLGCWSLPMLHSIVTEFHTLTLSMAFCEPCLLTEAVAVGFALTNGMLADAMPTRA